MKYLASLLLITGFIAIGALGPMFFDMGPGHPDGCIASAIDGKTCPTNIADFATHHISAIQAITTAIPSSLGWTLLLASLLLIFASILIFHKDLLFPRLEFLPQYLKDLTLHFLYTKQRIVSWLSLFELSPAL